MTSDKKDWLVLVTSLRATRIRRRRTRVDSDPCHAREVRTEYEDNEERAEAVHGSVPGPHGAHAPPDDAVADEQLRVRIARVSESVLSCGSLMLAPETAELIRLDAH